MNYNKNDLIAEARIAMLVKEASKIKPHSQKEAEEYFDSQDYGEGVKLMWVDEVDGSAHWLNDVTGEVVPAKEKTMPKGVKQYKAK